MQLAFFHGELEILHVGKDVFQRVSGLFQRLPGFRQQVGHDLVAMRVAAAGHHVLALGIGQEVDPQQRLASTRVAREADAGAGAATGVAEHHALDRHGGTHGGIDAVQAAVFACLVGFPRGKYRLHCLQQLGVHVLRESVAGVLLVEQQKALCQFAQLAEVQLALVTALGHALQLVFEQRGWQAFHHFAIAGDQAAVGVPD